MGIYAIYQLKDDPSLRYHRFESLDRLREAGRSVDWENYNHVYTGIVDAPGKSDAVYLENIFIKFNNHIPEDFRGHALSISDVVMLHCGARTETPYYIDSFDYVKTPEFREGPYKYYSTQRPIDIGTLPKTEQTPVRIVNFDEREWREDATFKAWGYAAYDKPLTENQIKDYELRAASDNPEYVRIAPIQFAARVEIVGKWEQAHRVNDVKRLTWYHGDMGTFACKQWTPHRQIQDRFNSIVEAKARAAENRAAPKRIADQIAEAQKLVERGGKETPAKKQNKSHEDR